MEMYSFYSKKEVIAHYKSEHDDERTPQKHTKQWGLNDDNCPLNLEDPPWLSAQEYLNRRKGEQEPWIVNSSQIRVETSRNPANNRNPGTNRNQSNDDQKRNHNAHDSEQKTNLLSVDAQSNDTSNNHLASLNEQCHVYGSNPHDTSNTNLFQFDVQYNDQMLSITNNTMNNHIDPMHRSFHDNGQISNDLLNTNSSPFDVQYNDQMPSITNNTINNHLDPMNSFHWNSQQFINNYCD